MLVTCRVLNYVTTWLNNFRGDLFCRLVRFFPLKENCFAVGMTDYQ